jgi:DNA-binding transcriptional regulator GbsR (MarR family)
MTEAKIINLVQQIESGQAKTDAEKILLYIKNNPLTTIYEMSKTLHMFLHTVSARLSALMEAGVVKAVGLHNIDGRTFSTLEYVPDIAQQQALRDAQEQERLNKHCKYILENHSGKLTDLTRYNLKQIMK